MTAGGLPSVGTWFLPFFPRGVPVRRVGGGGGGGSLGMVAEMVYTTC